MTDTSDHGGFGSSASCMTVALIPALLALVALIRKARHG